MGDLIDRQSVIDAITDTADKFDWPDDYHQAMKEGIRVGTLICSLMPSKQPEIIYCRECRHWYTGDGYNHENGAQCELMHMWMGPDDYCSYGRRKVSE